MTDGGTIPVPAPACTKGRVLVVEDDPDISDALCHVLTFEGYTTRSAANGFEALECVTSPEPPDLILLDLMMPGMDGCQFSAEQKKLPAAAGIPIIVVSADNKGAQKAAAIGAAAYLPKPIELDTLLGLLARYFQRPLKAGG